MFISAGGVAERIALPLWRHNCYRFIPLTKKRVLEEGDQRETKTANDLAATLVLSIWREGCFIFSLKSRVHLSVVIKTTQVCLIRVQLNYVIKKRLAV